MKVFLITIFVLILSHCSFDNKTGIWKNNNEIIEKKKDEYKGFKKLYTEEKLFNQIISPNKNLKILPEPIKLNKKWLDEFYQDTNNSDNFSYKNLNNKVFQSKKLSRHQTKDKILFDGENFLITDIRGNIIVYSVKYQKIIFKYNFYKNEFKGLKKNLNIIIEKNIVYTVDNLGYSYALNYVEQKLLWAKNYKIPFRSNIKIFKDKIVAANSDNTLFYLDKFSGNKIKSLPSEEVSIKNEFVNSIAVSKDTLYYLNTFGSIYSINNEGRINWFLNINQHSEIDTNNLFNSHPLILHKDKIIISTEKYFYIFNSFNGSRLVRAPITSIVKPIVSNKNIFIITKNNLLVCINIDTGSINYSLDISEEIANFLVTKKKNVIVKTLSMLNNNLYVLLDNSYYIRFSPNGKITEVKNLPAKLGSYPIFVNDFIMFLNKNKKLIFVN
ncbi:MAG: PQQ-binding-like beta-propeller repeat protein [Candidatus Pelagibacter sp.]